jgi:hypothetical protein
MALLSFPRRSATGAPALNGDPDRAVALSPESSGESALLVQFDESGPARYLRHAGTGSAGVVMAADVDTAAQILARVAADAPLGGRTSAGPGNVAMAFDFGMVAPAAAETVTVVTRLDAMTPSGVARRSARPAPPRLKPRRPAPPFPAGPSSARASSSTARPTRLSSRTG